MESEALQLREKTYTRVREKQEEKVIQYWDLTEDQQKAKRFFDLFITFLALPIILPIGIITAIIIKLDSRGPVFFIQERVGRHGDIFNMFKFRSMTVDAEINGNKFAQRNDQRVTAIGKFIRKFRIDEIPNFWNVLKGEMSVIGPRPEQVSFVKFFDEEIERYHYRHSVKPGITGLAQVNQGYAACTRSTQMKLNYDLFYIKHYSFGMEVNIVLKTMVTILTGFGSR